MDSVWLLKIDHDFGSTISAHRAREGAARALFEFVGHWWEVEMEDLPMPKDRDKAIEEYFGHLNQIGKEFYEIYEVDLRD